MRFAALVMLLSVAADRPDPREPFKPLADLIGVWQGLGWPEGTREVKQAGQWSERHNWQWQFKGDQAWLQVEFKDGKHFRRGELRYLPEQKRYRFTVQTATQQSLDFVGKLVERQLVLERTDEKSREAQRLVWSLLHFNRLVVRYEVKPDGKTLFTRVYQIGATKEGTPFANVPNGPECIVSGGAATGTVTYQGKTYYICCSGCRDAFLEEPEKYIKEYEAKRKK